MVLTKVAARHATVYAIALVTLLWPQFASAETVKYSLKGTIAYINVDNTFVDRLGAVVSGAPFEASFTFDTSVPDGSSDADLGSFLQPVPPFALSVSTGGLALSSTSRSFTLVQVENHSPGGQDAFYVSASQLDLSSGWSISNAREAAGTPSANFTFRDFSGIALTSDQLSELPPLDLSMFPETALVNSFALTLAGAGETLHLPDGSVITAAEGVTIFLSGTSLTATTLTNAGLDQTTAVGRTVTFSGSSTVVGGTTTDYSWDFGDGSPAESAAIATHAYSAPGTYLATLTVTNSDGSKAADTAIVTVVCCDVSVSVSPASARRGQTVSITTSIQNLSAVEQSATLTFDVLTPAATRLGSIAATFPAGLNKTLKLPFKIPANTPPGVYFVRLITTTSGGVIERTATLTVIP